jgi:hypothetical protein
MERSPSTAIRASFSATLPSKATQRSPCDKYHSGTRAEQPVNSITSLFVPAFSASLDAPCRQAPPTTLAKLPTLN